MNAPDRFVQSSSRKFGQDFQLSFEILSLLNCSFIIKNHDLYLKPGC